jgi:polyisoprenoid-binding protein YceI
MRSGRSPFRIPFFEMILLQLRNSCLYQASRFFFYAYISVYLDLKHEELEVSMNKSVLVFVSLAFLLAACSSAATPAAPQGNPTSAPVTTAAPATTEAAAATEAPAVTDAPAAGATVYKIVPGESVLQYEVGETFLNQGNVFNLAVGRSSQVAGDITLDPAAPQNNSLGTFTADISQFASDSDRRDNAIRGRYLESSKYPTVTFKPTAVEGLPQSYQDGQEITFKVSGDLTIRDVTKPVSFDVTAKLSGGTLSGQAVTTILMSDFGFGPISIAGILNTEDQAKVTLNFVARSDA